MGFCTLINCMDGRIQLPLIDFMRERFGAEFVDNITEPGPVQIFADGNEKELLERTLKKIDISITLHGSKVIAIAAHPDCAGNPVDDSLQKEQLKEAFSFLRGEYPNIEIVALWVERNKTVTIIRETENE